MKTDDNQYYIYLRATKQRMLHTIPSVTTLVNLILKRSMATISPPIPV